MPPLNSTNRFKLLEEMDQSERSQLERERSRDAPQKYKADEQLVDFQQPNPVNNGTNGTNGMRATDFDLLELDNVFKPVSAQPIIGRKSMITIQDSDGSEVSLSVRSVLTGPDPLDGHFWTEEENGAAATNPNDAVIDAVREDMEQIKSRLDTYTSSNEVRESIAHLASKLDSSATSSEAATAKLRKTLEQIKSKIDTSTNSNKGFMGALRENMEQMNFKLDEVIRAVCDSKGETGNKANLTNNRLEALQWEVAGLNQENKTADARRKEQRAASLKMMGEVADLRNLILNMYNYGPPVVAKNSNTNSTSNDNSNSNNNNKLAAEISELRALILKMHKGSASDAAKSDKSNTDININDSMANGDIAVILDKVQEGSGRILGLCQNLNSQLKIMNDRIKAVEEGQKKLRIGQDSVEKRLAAVETKVQAQTQTQTQAQGAARNGGNKPNWQQDPRRGDTSRGDASRGDASRGAADSAFQRGQRAWYGQQDDQATGW